MSKVWTLEILHDRHGWLRANSKVYRKPSEVNAAFDILKKQNRNARIMEYRAWCFDEPIGVYIRPIEE